MKTSIAAIVFASLAISATSSMAAKMDKAGIEKALKGKTYTVHLYTGHNGTDGWENWTDEPDGTLKTSKKGVKPGKWRVDNNGNHCVQFPRQNEFCAEVHDMGNGQYKKMKGTVKTIDISNVR